LQLPPDILKKPRAPVLPTNKASRNDNIKITAINFSSHRRKNHPCTINRNVEGEKQYQPKTAKLLTWRTTLLVNFLQQRQSIWVEHSSPMHRIEHSLSNSMETECLMASATTKT
jgi:hypothetical protein